MLRGLLLVVAILATAVAAARPNYKAMFADFQLTYNRAYASPAEEEARFQTFVANMIIASAQRATNPQASFGVNAFSDLSAAEFAARYRNGARYYAAVANRSLASPLAEDLESSAGKAQDWRKKGAVTHVKNQGQCGSCWSFSTTGSIEGQWAIKKKKLVPLSEQELVSCDTTDSGCNGGLMDNAFAWLVRNRGGAITTEAAYPYVSGSGNVPSCRRLSEVGAKITGFKNLPKNEVDMANWLYANGPVSVAVDATSWQTYQGGVLTDCISQQIDHGVLLVGFDDASNPPYWIVKNSWGPSWGESGYIRIKKGNDQCLVTSYPCTSVV